VSFVRRSRDTSLEAADRQLAELRKMSPSQRLEIAAAMTADVRRLAESGIRSRHPEFSPEQVKSEMDAILLRSHRRRTERPAEPGT